MPQQRIYLDNAATTPVDPRVLEAMMPYFFQEFGNPGSQHKEGVAAKKAALHARATIAKCLGARIDEVVFTSGGTEANNMAILGFAAHPELRRYALGDLRFITSVIEHPSVLDCFKELEERGALVSYIPVTTEGILDLRAFEEALDQKTAFISIMYANNEIGTIQPIGEITKILKRVVKERRFVFRVPGKKEPGPLFHVDASQAPLFLPIDTAKLDVDMLTLDAQKIYGPKGVGLLYVRKGVELAPLFYGGTQERGMRPGTENVPGIVGFAKALEIAGEEREKESARLAELRDYCIEKILAVVQETELNGSRTLRVPNNVNISFPGHDSEWLVLQLDAKGIAVGARSACMSAEESGSYVVAALGKGKEYTTGSVRITLGRLTTRKDIDALVTAFKEILAPICSNCRTPLSDIPTIYAHQDGSACRDVKA